MKNLSTLNLLLIIISALSSTLLRPTPEGSLKQENTTAHQANRENRRPPGPSLYWKRLGGRLALVPVEREIVGIDDWTQFGMFNEGELPPEVRAALKASNKKLQDHLEKLKEQ